MPKLIIKTQQDEKAIPLTRLRTTIGRSVRNNVCVYDKFASRFHAEIRREGDNFWLQDLGSANGTFCNGKPVKAPVLLMPGDEIQIGETIIFFQQDEPARHATLVNDSAFNPQATMLFSEIKSRTSEIIESKETLGTNDRQELLTLISRVGVALLGSDSLAKTLELLVSLVFDVVPAERCAILLRDEKNPDNLKIAASKERGNKNLSSEMRISRKIIEEVFKRGSSVLTSDAQQDPNLKSQTLILSGVRSILATPLRVRDETFGIIYADSPTNEAVFTEDHLKILTTLASVASIRVENARLAEERIERERLEQELRLAAEIQQQLQPSQFPSVENYEFQGISISCQEVGGDYYDFIAKDDKKVIVALGDVSGKGASAALLMSSLHASIHGQVLVESELSKILFAVNEYLAKHTPSNRFVTLFIAELDCKTGKFEYINAAHEPAILIRKNGEAEKLKANSLPLGLFENQKYETLTSHLGIGDILVIYSDGISEATNQAGDEFGSERLIKVVQENHHLSAAEIRDKIDSALSAFTDNFKDDITLVIVKRNN
ncbi:MAG: sigma factor sigB regulation protein rsbU [Pyrinomonadaceae bacterium]|nr:MAG: sigma factor sigB regulation protein rsbU [Pyrinomonadaceae bacterium]